MSLFISSLEFVSAFQDIERADAETCLCSICCLWESWTVSKVCSFEKPAIVYLQANPASFNISEASSNRIGLQMFSKTALDESSCQSYPDIDFDLNVIHESE